MTAAADGALERRSVIGFKDNKAGIEQLPLRNHDDVEARSDLVSTKNLSNQTFRSVSLDRAAQLLRRRDAQTTERELVREDEERAEPAMDACAFLVNLLKLRAGFDPFVRPEARQRLSGADCQPLAALRTAPLENEPPVLGAHPDEEAVRLATASGVWLERPLPLHRSLPGACSPASSYAG